MSEIDWLIDQFALVLEERDAEIAALTARIRPEKTQPATDDGSGAVEEPVDPEEAAEQEKSTDEEEQPRA